MELRMSKIHQGVSDHLRVSSDSIFYWKHQFALNNHNIIMKINRFTWFMTKSLGKFFFCGQFGIFVGFWIFSSLKIWFLDLVIKHWVTGFFNLDFKRLYSKKNTFVDYISAILCKKKLNARKCIFFIYVLKNIYILTTKS